MAYVYEKEYVHMKKFREAINRIRNNYSQNAGFTLVELIIVITVLAILCGISAVGILSWQDWAAFKKENEYAKTLFVAAQNQLSEYSANGRLEEMIADADSLSGDDTDTKALLIRNTIDDTVQYSMIPDVNESVVSTVTNRTDVSYDGVIVAITADAGSYMDYLQKMKDSDYFYKIYVLTSNISEDKKERIKALLTENSSIELCDVKDELEKIRADLQLRDYYSLETYYRFFIDSLFPQYDKVIYLDCDIIVKGDISKFYNTNIKNYLVAAVPEQVMQKYKEFSNKYNALIFAFSILDFSPFAILKSFSSLKC